MLEASVDSLESRRSDFPILHRSSRPIDRPLAAMPDAAPSRAECTTAALCVPRAPNSRHDLAGDAAPPSPPVTWESK